jgi:hypothetical protein
LHAGQCRETFASVPRGAQARRAVALRNPNCSIAEAI